MSWALEVKLVTGGDLPSTVLGFLPENRSIISIGGELYKVAARTILTSKKARIWVIDHSEEELTNENQ